MNLWVRSQDKENLILIKNPICVYDNKIIYKESASYIITIAEYKTKERAIEVLDEIQNILKPKIVIKFDNKPKYLEDGTINDVLTPREEIDYSKQLSTYVYEMPEK